MLTLEIGAGVPNGPMRCSLWTRTWQFRDIAWSLMKLKVGTGDKLSLSKNSWPSSQSLQIPFHSMYRLCELKDGMVSDLFGQRQPKNLLESTLEEAAPGVGSSYDHQFDSLLASIELFSGPDRMLWTLRALVYVLSTPCIFSW